MEEEEEEGLKVHGDKSLIMSYACLMPVLPCNFFAYTFPMISPFSPHKSGSEFLKSVLGCLGLLMAESFGLRHRFLSL